MKKLQMLILPLLVLFILSSSFISSAAETEPAQEEAGAGAVSPFPDEPPAFQARLEYWMGYTVIGTFADFTPDITQIQTMSSPDGEHWQAGGNEWNLYALGTEDEDRLQIQPCLYPANEPLRSYLAGDIDRFYVKLRITREDGRSYDTQTAVIDRGGPRPIPEGTECGAWFSSGIAVTEPAPDSPHLYVGYGRYQLTVSADASAEEIQALLPDTLPVEVRFTDTENRLAIGTVDCPISWKSLSLPPLVPGESITILDAAEEISVPAGTLVSTPLGVFELTQTLRLNAPPTTDEVRLVLNVSSESRTPIGVLREERNGLQVAFHHKPTGAVSIQAYVLTEGEAAWTRLSELSLSEDFYQPSTANSSYALVLGNEQEPYRSYLAAVDAGETPTPFFIGLNIEGGVYDGRQLILPWPDVYETLPDLPKLTGAGGNQGNAGADNKEDSTQGGQRPTLPQTMEDPGEDGGQAQGEAQEAQKPGAETGGTSEEQLPNTGTAPDSGGGTQAPDSGAVSDGGGNTQSPDAHTSLDPGQRTPALNAGASSEDSDPAPASSIPADRAAPASEPQPDRPEDPPMTGQRPGLPQTAPASSDLSMAPIVVQAADGREAGSLPSLADPDADAEHAAKPDRRLPLLPLAVVIAGACTGEAVRRKTGSTLAHRIAEKVQEILHR